jgi:hypothetical protein
MLSRLAIRELLDNWHVGAVGWLATRSNETGASRRRIAVRPFVHTGLLGRVVFGFGTAPSESTLVRRRAAGRRRCRKSRPSAQC